MEKIITLAIPVYFISIFAEAYFSLKLKKNYYNLKDSLGNIGTGILMQMRELLTKVWLIAGYTFIVREINVLDKLNLSFWSEDITTSAGLISWSVGFILTDFVYYLFHRHSHEVNLFWMGHIVHHSSEEYNLSVALRQSSIQGLFFFLYLIPLAVIGLPSQIVFGCYGLNLIYQFFIHTRFVGKLGVLEFIFNTPSHHRVHHARQGKYLDCNYAGVFIVWDRLLGTFTEEQEEPKYGVYPRFQSYDSVRANILPITELLRYLMKAKGEEKLKVLFSGPLWIFEHFKKGKSLNILGSKAKVDSICWLFFLGGLAFALVALFTPQISFTSQLALSVGVLLMLGLLGRRLDQSGI